MQGRQGGKSRDTLAGRIENLSPDHCMNKFCLPAPTSSPSLLTFHSRIGGTVFPLLLFFLFVCRKRKGEKGGAEKFPLNAFGHKKEEGNRCLFGGRRGNHHDCHGKNGRSRKRERELAFRQEGKGKTLTSSIFDFFYRFAYTCSRAMFGNDIRDCFPFFLPVKTGFFLLRQRHGESHTGEDVR